MTIYKVRFLDMLGKEVAEFGFYECKDDARRRKLEVSRLIKQEGNIEIREITPKPPSKFIDRRTRKPKKDFYEFK